MQQASKYCVLPQDRAEIQLDPSGPGAWEPTTVIDSFLRTRTIFGSRPAMCFKGPKAQGAEWKQMTYQEYWTESMLFAKALVKNGIHTFDMVNIMGFNSPEWLIASMGTNLAGCITAGVYTTNSASTCRYVAAHSKAKVIVLDGNHQLEKFTKMNNPLPDLKIIVVWGPEEVDSSLSSRLEKVRVLSWSSFLESAAGEEDHTVEARWAYIQPGNCAALIYTSGTTGPPKAVMISHDNLTWTARNICENYVNLNHTDSAVSFLPLSHIAAQLIDIHCTMYIGASLWFAQKDALKGSLALTMREVQPTFFFAVPRVWEKMQQKIESEITNMPWWKQWLVAAAKAIGRRTAVRCQFGGDSGTSWGYSLANWLVFSKIKHLLGLSRSKHCFTAAAPIAPETLWYFASLDIRVMEVFGQSECTGPHIVSTNREWKIGTCGRPILGSMTKLDPSTGELCYRGRHIFMGYLFAPEETKASFDRQDFFRSGDVAEIDSDGFVKITDRIKDIIVTAGGENVAPTLIEREVTQELPETSHCMIIGDHRRFLSMLVSLKVKPDDITGLPSDHLEKECLMKCKELGSDAELYSQVQNDPKWREYVDQCIQRANAKATSSAQKIQRWTWLPTDLCEKEGDITPTMKLRRNMVTKKYTELIDGLYR